MRFRKTTGRERRCKCLKPYIGRWLEMLVGYYRPQKWKVKLVKLEPHNVNFALIFSESEEGEPVCCQIDEVVEFRVLDQKPKDPGVPFPPIYLPANARLK